MAKQLTPNNLFPFVAPVDGARARYSSESVTRVEIANNDTSCEACVTKVTLNGGFVHMYLRTRYGGHKITLRWEGGNEDWSVTTSASSDVEEYDRVCLFIQ